MEKVLALYRDRAETENGQCRNITATLLVQYVDIVVSVLEKFRDSARTVRRQ